MSDYGPDRMADTGPGPLWKIESTERLSGTDEGLIHRHTASWQPISTAPKDGTEILAYNKYGRMLIAYDDMWTCRAEGEDIYGVDGWFTIHESRLDGWQPLPEPPTGDT